MFAQMTNEQLAESIEDWARLAENLRRGGRLHIRNDRGNLIRHAQNAVAERYAVLMQRIANE